LGDGVLVFSGVGDSVGVNVGLGVGLLVGVRVLVCVRVGAGDDVGAAVRKLDELSAREVPGLGEGVGVPLVDSGVGVSCRVHDMGNDSSGSKVGV
jgi:hypothetical protein